MQWYAESTLRLGAHRVCVQVSAPDCTMTMEGSPELEDGSKYNDCGGYLTSCIFFVMFQVCPVHHTMLQLTRHCRWWQRTVC